MVYLKETLRGQDVLSWVIWTKLENINKKNYKVEMAKTLKSKHKKIEGDATRSSRAQLGESGRSEA